MNLWPNSWFEQKPQLTPKQRQRLNTWLALPPPQLATTVTKSRYVVVDVETSGLNMAEDRLISIGAVAVESGQIVLGDCFYVILQQAIASDKENILLHGITSSAQIEGVPASDGLLDFLEFVQKAPIIAFHVTFDRTMIQRALRQFLGIAFKHPWLDMAYVMPALNPPLASSYHSLDDWIVHYAIRNEARHNALADAMVTAQLFQIALHQARKKNIVNFDQLFDLEKAQRWVSNRI